jgi:hydrogenase nickel incorporation protein HypA/HybF
MHELSVALSIVDGVLEELAQRGGDQVSAVYLHLGPLAGISEEALASAYAIACEGTPLEGSRLIIERVDVIIFCSECRVERKLTSVYDRRCPECGKFASELVGGAELEIAAMEMITA